MLLGFPIDFSYSVTFSGSTLVGSGVNGRRVGGPLRVGWFLSPQLDESKLFFLFRSACDVYGRA